MTTIGTRELRQNLSDVLRRVERGERLVITSRNRPVAELGPLQDADRGLARLIAEGRASKSERPLEFKPVSVRGDRAAASKALGHVRGER